MSTGSMSTHGVLFEGQLLNHWFGAPRLRAVLTMAPTSLLSSVHFHRRRGLTFSFPHGTGYPLAGCAPAEPASVSPDLFSIPF